MSVEPSVIDLRLNLFSDKTIEEVYEIAIDNHKLNLYPNSKRLNDKDEPENSIFSYMEMNNQERMKIKTEIFNKDNGTLLDIKHNSSTVFERLKWSVSSDEASVMKKAQEYLKKKGKQIEILKKKSSEGGEMSIAVRIAPHLIKDSAYCPDALGLTWCPSSHVKLIYNITKEFDASTQGIHGVNGVDVLAVSDTFKETELKYGFAFNSNFLKMNDNFDRMPGLLIPLHFFRKLRNEFAGEEYEEKYFLFFQILGIDTNHRTIEEIDKDISKGSNTTLMVCEFVLKPKTPTANQDLKRFRFSVKSKQVCSKNFAEELAMNIINEKSNIYDWINLQSRNNVRMISEKQQTLNEMKNFIKSIVKEVYMTPNQLNATPVEFLKYMSAFLGFNLKTLGDKVQVLGAYTMNKFLGPINQEMRSTLPNIVEIPLVGGAYNDRLQAALALCLGLFVLYKGNKKMIVFKSEITEDTIQKYFEKGLTDILHILVASQTRNSIDSIEKFVTTAQEYLTNQIRNFNHFYKRSCPTSPNSTTRCENIHNLIDKTIRRNMENVYNNSKTLMTTFTEFLREVRNVKERLNYCNNWLKSGNERKTGTIRNLMQEIYNKENFIIPSGTSLDLNVDLTTLRESSTSPITYVNGESNFKKSHGKENLSSIYFKTFHSAGARFTTNKNYTNRYASNIFQAMKIQKELENSLRDLEANFANLKDLIEIENQNGQKKIILKGIRFAPGEKLYGIQDFVKKEGNEKYKSCNLIIEIFYKIQRLLQIHTILEKDDTNFPDQINMINSFYRQMMETYKGRDKPPNFIWEKIVNSLPKNWPEKTINVKTAIQTKKKAFGELFQALFDFEKIRWAFEMHNRAEKRKWPSKEYDTISFFEESEIGIAKAQYFYPLFAKNSNLSQMINLKYLSSNDTLKDMICIMEFIEKYTTECCLTYNNFVQAYSQLPTISTGGGRKIQKGGTTEIQDAVNRFMYENLGEFDIDMILNEETNALIKLSCENAQKSINKFEEPFRHSCVVSELTNSLMKMLKICNSANSSSGASSSSNSKPPPKNAEENSPMTNSNLCIEEASNILDDIQKHYQDFVAEIKLRMQDYTETINLAKKGIFPSEKSPLYGNSVYDMKIKKKEEFIIFSNISSDLINVIGFESVSDAGATSWFDDMWFTEEEWNTREVEMTEDVAAPSPKEEASVSSTRNLRITKVMNAANVPIRMEEPAVSLSNHLTNINNMTEDVAAPSPKEEPAVLSSNRNMTENVAAPNPKEEPAVLSSNHNMTEDVAAPSPKETVIPAIYSIPTHTPLRKNLISKELQTPTSSKRNIILSNGYSSVESSNNSGNNENLRYTYPNSRYKYPRSVRKKLFDNTGKKGGQRPKTILKKEKEIKQMIKDFNKLFSRKK